DEVHGHPAPPPVAVRPEELGERGEAVRRFDGGQQNRPVARDAVGPEEWLGAAIGAELALGRASGGIPVEEVAGELLEERRLRRADAELPELDLGGGPGQAERA